VKPSLAIALASLGVAGCLPAVGGNQTPPECQQDTDCPVAGQVCDEGLCWGGVPADASYAALIGPPASSRGDLIATEVPELDIPDDGGFGDLVIRAPVAIGGRIHLGCSGVNLTCDPSITVAATITVLRPSRIPGGPLYIDSAASGSSIPTGDSFTINVPRLALGDEPYTLTITPSDSEAIAPDGPTPAQLAPPLTIQVDATDSVTGLDVALGEGSLRTVSGRVVDATGTGVAGVRVSAQGRFDAARPLERVSTVAVTDALGAYTIFIAEAAYPIVDIVGQPTDNTGLTLRLRDVPADQAAQQVGDLRMPGLGSPIQVTLPVAGLSGAGQSTAIVGASVVLTTQIDDPQHPTQVTTFAATGSTDAKGNATLSLIPAGSTLREYHVRISPPPTSEFATVWDQVLEVGSGGGVLGQLVLPHRLAVTGTLLDADGAPATGVTMVAKPALRFTLSLDTATQVLVSALQPPSGTTQDDGSFFVWVDPDLAGLVASYDLEAQPSAGARVPRWTFPDVEVADASTNVDKGALTLPRGRHVRGRIVDGTGEIVAGSEVRIYEPVSDVSLCSVAGLAADCVLPAALRALDRSDDAGIVRLVLPDPP
jgi:hypothetical protein